MPTGWRPIPTWLNPVMTRFDVTYLGEWPEPFAGDRLRKDDEYHIEATGGRSARVVTTFYAAGRNSVYIKTPTKVSFEWRITGPSLGEEDDPPASGHWGRVRLILDGSGAPNPTTTLVEDLYTNEMGFDSAWRSVFCEFPWADDWFESSQQPAVQFTMDFESTLFSSDPPIDTLEIRKLWIFNAVLEVDLDGYPGWVDPNDPEYSPGVPGGGIGSIVTPGEPGGGGEDVEFGPMSLKLDIPRKTWPVGDPERFRQALEREGVEQAEEIAKAFHLYTEQWALDEEDNYRAIEVWANNVRPTLEEEV